MKSPQISRIAIAATIVCAVVFLLFVTRKAIVGRTGIALTHPEENQEPGAQSSALPPSASGSTPQLNPPQFARQNELSPGTDPKPAGNGSANPMQNATNEVLSAPSFVAFAAATNLSAAKRFKIAEILALTQLNTEFAERSADPTIRSLIPGRVRKDAEIQILTQLTKEERDVAAHEHLISRLFPENSTE